MKYTVIILLAALFYISIASPIAHAQTSQFVNFDDFYTQFHTRPQQAPTPTPSPIKKNVQSPAQSAQTQQPIPTPTSVTTTTQKSSSASAAVQTNVTPTPVPSASANSSSNANTQTSDPAANTFTSSQTTTPVNTATPQNIQTILPLTDAPISIPQSDLGINLMGVNYYKSDQLPQDLTVNLTRLSFVLFIMGASFLRGPEIFRSINEWRLRNSTQKPARPFSIPYLEF
jgi:hypothetical protein